MQDLATLLPAAGGFGAVVAVLYLLLRHLLATRAMLAEADARYRAEVVDHEATQKLLDDERKQRRQAEDRLDKALRALRPGGDEP